MWSSRHRSSAALLTRSLKSGCRWGLAPSEGAWEDSRPTSGGSRWPLAMAASLRSLPLWSHCRLLFFVFSIFWVMLVLEFSTPPPPSPHIIQEGPFISRSLTESGLKTPPFQIRSSSQVPGEECEHTFCGPLIHLLQGGMWLVLIKKQNAKQSLKPREKV